MAEQVGKVNQVWVLAGATPIANNTGAKVNGVDNSSFNRLSDMLDYSQFGDSYHDRKAGLSDTSVTISGNYDPADTNGQNILDNPGVEVHIGVYPSGTAVAGKQVNALVESFEISADATGKQTFSCTLQGIAAPVALPLRP